MIDYDQILFIDKHCLDEECVNQPRLFSEFAKRAAELWVKVEEMKSKADIAKSRLEEVRAKIYLGMKKTPTKYGLPEKPTENHLDAAITVRKAYQKALAAYQKACFDIVAVKTEHSFLSDFLKALDMRKFGISELIELHGRDYFSEPKTAKGGKVSMEELLGEMTHKKVLGHLNKKKKKVQKRK